MFPARGDVLRWFVRPTNITFACPFSTNSLFGVSFKTGVHIFGNLQVALCGKFADISLPVGLADICPYAVCFKFFMFGADLFAF